MRKIFTLGILLSGTLLANEPKVYIDMSPVLLNYSDNGTTTDFKPTGFKWTVGYVLKDFDLVGFALEGNLLVGVDSDSKLKVKGKNGITLNQADVALDKLYGLHLKTIIPVTDTFNVNLYSGASRAKIISLASNSINKNSFKNSVSYGVGLEYWSSADVSLYGNYMQYFKNLSAIEFGLGFKF